MRRIIMEVINLNLKYTNPCIPLQLEKVFFIILHHTAIETAAPEDIHKWHLDNGWNGFGYNEYIRKDGKVYIGRGDNIGAQCAGMNSKSYGICCEGNYDLEMEMPEAQLNSLIQRIKDNKNRFKNFFGIDLHKWFFETSCPGINFPFEKIIDRIVQSEDTLQAHVDILLKNGILASPDYWLKNAVPQKTVNGEYAGTLIRNMARKLSTDGN